ncbi:MAG: hypothetical protein K2N64_05655 [Anaeroplasmataceae bacterium]|nr:hypothetical protein [Anaeroplasmataceae bacterium]
MNRLLLIDGSNLLFQMFYGMPSRILSKDGKPIQGVLGFIGALKKIITSTDPTHICVLFDGEHENKRTQLLEDYKKNRMDYGLLPEEETPFSQLESIYSALTFMHIPYVELTDYETDDYIASYVKKYASTMQIIISSWDSDYFSLIQPNVSIYRYRGKKSYFCDVDYIKKTYKISPTQYIFYKSLIGDSSDNIKGIPKIGPVSASKIVNAYSSISDLYAHLKECPFHNHLEGYQERLLLNEQIISFYILDTLPFSLEELFLPLCPLTTLEVLKHLDLL